MIKNIPKQLHPITMGHLRTAYQSAYSDNCSVYIYVRNRAVEMSRLFQDETCMVVQPSGSIGTIQVSGVTNE